MLHRQQREPVLLRRPAQRVDADAGVVQLLQQLQARLAGLALQSLQQPLGREIGAVLAQWEYLRSRSWRSSAKPTRRSSSSS